MKALVEATERNKINISALTTSLGSRKRKHCLSEIPQEYIYHAIERPILDSVYANIQPIIKDLNVAVTNMLQKNHDEMYSALWPKLSLALRVTDVLTMMITRDHLNSEQ
jgi:hypothetical protein